MDSSAFDAKLKLLKPDSSLREEFQAFCIEFASEGLIHGIGSMDPKEFDRSLQASDDHALGLNLREGWVPSETFWLLREGKQIVGTINLRHALTPFLEAEGGHIGYAVRPSERRKGYATHMLKDCLNIARARGLRRVLITCDSKNIASARVIEKAGGQLYDEVPSLTTPISTTRRYWIELEAVEM